MANPKLRQLRVEGHYKPLYVLVESIGHSRCGTIRNGVAFMFGNEGGWVVDRNEIHRLSRELKAQGKQRKKPTPRRALGLSA